MHQKACISKPKQNKVGIKYVGPYFGGKIARNKYLKLHCKFMPFPFLLIFPIILE